MNPFTRFLGGWPGSERAVLKRQILAIFGVITLLNLGFYWQSAIRAAADHQHIESIIQGWDGLAWYVWMPAAPATLLLIRRYPLQPGRVRSSVAGLLGGSALIYFLVTSLHYVLRVLPNFWLPDRFDRPVDWYVYLMTQIERAPLDLLTYCGLFATSFAIDFHSKYRHREDEVLRLQLQAAQLHSELARAQLAALRGQLHPHFLFNAFNSIATLVRQRRNDAAVEMIANLGDLLRLAMEKVDQQEVRLAQEMEFVEAYLRVERVRFAEKLRTELRVSPETLSCSMPGFLLQPLVENAIKHGIAKRLTPGTISLTTARKAERLWIEIANDGPENGSESAATLPTGIGLKNTRARLKHAYGEDFGFEVHPRSDAPSTVTLDLPWRPLPAPASPGP